MNWYNVWWKSGTALMLARSQNHAREQAEKEFGLEPGSVAAGPSQSMNPATTQTGDPSLEAGMDSLIQATDPAELHEATFADKDVGLRGPCFTSGTIH